MSAQMLAPTSENWDDDFEFGHNNSSNSPRHKNASKQEPATKPPLQPRLSVASTHFSEDWDADDRPRQPSPRAGSSRTGTMSGISNRLHNWAEPGPSTPTKQGGAHAQADNWDDDFEDKADSPPNRRHHANRTFQHSLRTRHSYHTPPRPKPFTEPENWDDDFDDPLDPSTFTSPNKTNNDTTPMTKRTRRETYADSSDEDDVDFGFSEDKEEDKTVTARSRTAPMLRPGSSHSHSRTSSHYSSLPPVPALPLPFSPSPIEPFPRSPTGSVFSIPTTSGRNSIGHFNSTSHLVLSGASSLAMLPPSPPQRERRRLRKKSRPPNMDNNVFELIEEPRDSSPPLPPSTPERASSPPMVPTMHSTPLEATPGGGGSRTPLLSRIGSVKRWGVRRKRASTGPAEVMMHELSRHSIDEESATRPPSSLEQTQAQTPSSKNRNSSHTGGTRTTWFFRPGGAHYGAGSPPPGQAELKHERSLDQGRLRPGVGVGESSRQVPTTPSKGWLSRPKTSGGPLEYTSNGDRTGDGSSSASGVIGSGKPSLGPGRRPSSMQVPNGALSIGTGSSRFGSIGTRHASYGSSVGRASASRIFSAPTPTESMDDLPPMPDLPAEGSRGFMGSIRKISLVGGKKHKTWKSSLDLAAIPPTPTDLDDVGDEEGREFDDDGDVRMHTPSPQAPTPDLLPPIELHPPSPPRAINGMSAAHSIPLNISDSAELMMPSTSAPASITISMTQAASSLSPVASKTTLKTPSSPQSASLGRATQAPNPPASNASILRRNSLGDLKIPARISRAQIGLKRDLGMVREFATSVDKLKELQSAYLQLLAEVQIFLENVPPPRATSPNVFSLVSTRSRLRSNTSPPSNPLGSSNSFSEHKQIAATLYAITVKYKISWECAELLIELGGGAPPTSPPESGPSPSLSAPSVSTQAELDRWKNRERAITLSGEESKPPAVAAVSGAATPPSMAGPSNPSWRASTGRHDLSQRQLVLLRDMLNSGELPPDEIEETVNVNRNWRWGDAMNSTITLPSEESGSRGGIDHGENTKKKRRGGRMGLTGLRDMLRMLKRSHSEQVSTPPVPALPLGPSTASLNTESSCSHHYPHGHVGADSAQQVVKSSTGAESARPTKDTPVNSPYGGSPIAHKSPRRPSLASIFRLGHKHKGGTTSSTGESSQDSRSDVRSASRGSNMSEEDWDRIDSAIDLDTAARVLGIGDGTATVKGRKHCHGHGRASPAPFLSDVHRPVTPRRVLETTQAIRLEVEASPRSIRPMRSTRLSNVEEVSDGERPARSEVQVQVIRASARTSPHRPPSRGLMPGTRTGSVRSVPPQPLDEQTRLPEKLSMTPENIGPLLENAKEVHTRCHECIRELRALVDAMPAGVVSPVSAS